MFGVFLFFVLSARCGGEDTTYYSALAKHASASGAVVLLYHYFLYFYYCITGISDGNKIKPVSGPGA